MLIAQVNPSVKTHPIEWQHTYKSVHQCTGKGISHLCNHHDAGVRATALLQRRKYSPPKRQPNVGHESSDAHVRNKRAHA